jgi:hypothetical protein
MAVALVPAVATVPITIRSSLALSARDKLNAAYLLGSLAAAALLGTLLQSWTVFAGAAILLIAVCCMGRSIRLPRR